MCLFEDRLRNSSGSETSLQKAAGSAAHFHGGCDSRQHLPRPFFLELAAAPNVLGLMGGSGRGVVLIQEKETGNDVLTLTKVEHSELDHKTFIVCVFSISGTPVSL